MKHSLAQQAFLESLDPTPGRWTEVLPNEHRTALALERQGRVQIRRIDARHWEAQPANLVQTLTQATNALKSCPPAEVKERASDVRKALMDLRLSGYEGNLQPAIEILVKREPS